MEAAQVREHWETQARRHGADLLATTKTSTIKRLEISALARAFAASDLVAREACRVLEVGCGNGHNALELAQRFEGMHVLGVDYAAAMVDAARARAREYGLTSRVRFESGDVLALDETPAVDARYDAIFTDRCLINLDSTERQLAAIRGLAARLEPGGWLWMVENSRQTHAGQNDLREALGLARRAPAEFNVFFDDERIVPELHAQFAEVRIEDFATLHDLLLYVLLPASNGGRVEYGHPVVEAATELGLRAPGLLPDALAGYPTVGQNRLYACRVA